MRRDGFGGSMPRARILAVDDQLYFRVFLEDLLVQEGYEVRTAAGGEEALHLFEREDFDVVLTDLVMPGLDGAELVQRIKDLRPDQDVVVITSVGDVKTAVDAMKLGATDYLLKPIDRTVLARALEGLKQVGRSLGIGIGNMVVVISPDRIVIGGGVAAAGELLFAPIRAELERRVKTTSLDRVELVTAELGTWAGAIGAAVHGAERAAVSR